MKKKLLTVSISTDLIDKLESFHEEVQRNKSIIVENAIKEYIEKESEILEQFRRLRRG